MAYGAPFSFVGNRSTTEKLQTKFLKAILLLPTNASNVMVHLETELVTIEARLWIIILSYWLKLNHANSGLAHLILKDNCLPVDGTVGEEIGVLQILTSVSNVCEL